MAKSVWQTKCEQAQKELEAFKQQVKETAWEWEGGCDEGKREFIEELGLTPPSERYYFSVNVWLDTANHVKDGDLLADVVQNAIELNAELVPSGSYSVEVSNYYKD